MTSIALNGATISESTASSHITYRKWEDSGMNTDTYCTAYDANGDCISWGGGDDIYEWNNYTTSATVTGTATSSVSNVLIQGKAPIVNGDTTTENETYVLPSGGQYVSGQHTNASGSVSSGNSSNVRVNGKLVSISGSNVTTHASTSATLNGGLSTTVNIG